MGDEGKGAVRDGRKDEIKGEYEENYEVEEDGEKVEVKEEEK